MSLGSAPQIDWQAMEDRPFGGLEVGRTQSSRVWPSSLAASLDFHGALTPTLVASASRPSAVMMSPCTSRRGAARASRDRARCRRRRRRSSPVVDLERLHPDRLRERGDVVLRRPDVLPADLGDLAARDLGVERAPADAVAGLEHDDRMARLDERPGGGETGEARADHHHVGGLGAPLGGRKALGPSDRDERRASGGGADQLAAGDSLGHCGDPTPRVNRRDRAGTSPPERGSSASGGPPGRRAFLLSGDGFPARDASGRISNQTWVVPSCTPRGRRASRRGAGPSRRRRSRDGRARPGRSPEP